VVLLAEPHDDSAENVVDPNVAAVDLLETFRLLARTLCRHDRFLQDDLVQEMALATLESSEPRTVSSYCVTAVWRAQNYLRLWNAQRYRPGCEKHVRSSYDPRVEEKKEEPVRRAEEVAGRLAG